MPDVKPIAGPSTESALDQTNMVVPAAVETIGTSEENARQGGRIYTCEHSGSETRPQEMHGAVNYQKTTADPGKAPTFYDYTSLTANKGTVRG